MKKKQKIKWAKALIGEIPNRVSVSFVFESPLKILADCRLDLDTQKVEMRFNLNAVEIEREFLSVVAHEKCHAQQFLSGRLVMTNEFCIFDGIRYNNWKEIPHHIQPWEIEAIEAEEKAYYGF
tara:strand:+ start:2260 stop:2628 length:369 start_codon:yes stop_codon:yes gene_type:complete